MTEYATLEVGEKDSFGFTWPEEVTASSWTVSPETGLTLSGEDFAGLSTSVWVQPDAEGVYRITNDITGISGLETSAVLVIHAGEEYVSANGTAASEADNYAGGTGLPALKQASILRDSERLVKRYAPPPDPVTEEYQSAAKDSEMRVYEYLTTTSGYTSSVGLSGISINYVALTTIEALVRGVMADYVADSGASNVGTVTRVPRRR